MNQILNQRHINNNIDASYDKSMMRYALRLAARGQGRVGENPSVGCVIVKDQAIIATGWTQSGGRPHAETHALERAGRHASGATAYVTLEPCAHYGRTPPCAQALIDASIARVVVACGDSDTRVNGQGIAMLRDAGIEVSLGVCAQQASQSHYGFFRRMQDGLPEISVKIATSYDEKITTGDGGQWLTNTMSRRIGHMLRAQHQAIVTGVGTATSDDPMLDCRISGLKCASPLRIILDRSCRLSPASKLVRSARDIVTWVCCNESQRNSRAAQTLHNAGVVLEYFPEGFTFRDAMQRLGANGINRVLIEGGQSITTAALDSQLATTLYWFQASHVIGNSGLCATFGASLKERCEHYKLQTRQALQGDVLRHYAIN